MKSAFSLEYNRQHFISEGSLYNLEQIPRLDLLLTTIYKHFDLHLELLTNRVLLYVVHASPYQLCCF